VKILIDMNLSPEWVQEFKRRDVEAVHWSTVGRFDAADKVLMEFARQNQYVILRTISILVPR